MQEQGEVDAMQGEGPAVAVGRERAATSAPPEAGRRALEVLLVCTGNICRSPVAEVFLRQHLIGLGSDAIVRSAGLRSGGERADPVVVKMLRPRGFRLRKYRSTTLREEMLTDADLVVAMATEHVEAIVLMAPQSWSRVFTLKELIRRNEVGGGRRPGETFDEWLAALHSGRKLDELAPWSPENDIADPIGRSLREHEDMVDEVEALTRRLADVLAGAQHTWPIEPGEMPPISLEGMWSGDTGPSVAGPEAKDAIGPDDGDTTEETSMKEAEVTTDEGEAMPGLFSPAGTPDDGLRSAKEALMEAQRAMTETAQQLAEVVRSSANAQSTTTPDAYTQLGDEVAAVMRSAAAQSSVVRDDAEGYARRVSSEADADASALRERSKADASEMRRKAEDDSATMRREADAAAKSVTSKADEHARRVRDEADEAVAGLRAAAATERLQASTEATDLRQAATVQSSTVRDEADRYAKSTRSAADADATHLRNEADRYAGNVRGVAEMQGTEIRNRAEHDAATMRLAAEDDARAMRWDAEQEATKVVSEANARYAELIVAEGDLRSRLEGAASALVSALEGRQHVLSPPLALTVPVQEEKAEPDGEGRPPADEAGHHEPPEQE